jgi:hypothetical protein
MFVRPLTAEEKEAEKNRIDHNLGFKGIWQDGWIKYDGTIIVLDARPGMDGDAYYTRKCNYGLNLQVRSILYIGYSITKQRILGGECAVNTTHC